MASTIQLKRGLSTSANWSSVIPLPGEPVFLTDTKKLYIGDGTSKTLINPTYGTAANADTGTAAGNVPILDSNGKINSSLIPSVFVNNVYVVTNKADLTTLINAQTGDMAIVTSTSETYALQSLPATTISNWIKLLFNNAVLSVNGFSGVVTVSGADILLTGYTIATSSSLVTTTDSINVAIGKLQYQTQNIDGGTF